MTLSSVLRFRLVAALDGAVAGLFFSDSGVLDPFCICAALLGVPAMLLAGLLGVPAILLAGLLDIGEATLLSGLLDTGELGLLERGEVSGLLLRDLEETADRDLDRLLTDTDRDLDRLEDASLESSTRESSSLESLNLESSRRESNDCERRLLSSLDLPPGLGVLLVVVPGLTF